MNLIISATKNNNFELGQKLLKVSQSIKMNTIHICLEDFEIPLYTPTAETEGISEKVIELTELMTKATSLILCAPEYNGSIPPIVNNAIAWVSRSGNEDWRAAFNSKPAVVATHSGGGGLKVTQAMRAQLEHLGSIVLPRPIITNFQKPLNLDSATSILSQLKNIAE